jgi:D-xylose transport system ATP-binding protein
MTPAHNNGHEPIVRMENIDKHFGGVYAVNDVSFELYPGEVLALVGDNGAGKSTLVKILSGAYIADGGRIFVHGEEARIERPTDARKLGIEMIYQHLALMNNLDIPSNIFMGREVKTNRLLGPLGFMNLKKMRQSAIDLLDTFEIDIGDINQEVRNLSGGQRQMVAISRAVYFQAQVIIMDEPTAALGVAETKKVYDFVRKLQANSIAVVIISHNINEVFDIADRLMVLKTGSLVGIKNKSETNTDEIVSMIIAGKHAETMRNGGNSLADDYAKEREG